MPKKIQEREDRIHNEIVVDANGREEVVMSWYYYLQDMIAPFTATCIAERESSPLRKGDEVEVTDMASLDQCQHEMFVLIRWEHKRPLAVPLSQLKPISDAGELTTQAVQDWHYWVKQGYEL
jgi:hypothetical protein